MGACASTPANLPPSPSTMRAHATEPTHVEPNSINTACKAQHERRAVTGTAIDSCCSHSPDHVACTPMKTLLQIQELQTALASVSDAPGLGLSEAAELLHTELGVALVSIYGFCSSAASGGGTAAVLLASHGCGATTLEGLSVLEEGSCSALRLKYGARDRLEATVQSYEEQDPRMPSDWALLHQEAGLHSFVAVPIGLASKPLGVLMVASESPEDLEGSWWHMWPSVAAVALVHHLRHWQTVATCKLLTQGADIKDRLEFVSFVLKGASAFMLRATNLQARTRLAVFDKLCTKALLFEQGAAAPGPEHVSESLSFAPDGKPNLIASEMELTGTLLAGALALRKARFVRDVPTYMQSSLQPVRDIFTRGGHVVASLVVVPLVYRDEQPVAALYLTLEAPNDFGSIQAPLLGFINTVLPLLYLKLKPHVDDIWGEALAVLNHSAKLRSLMSRGGSCSSVAAACEQGLMSLTGAAADAPGSASGEGSSAGPSSSGAAGVYCSNKSSSNTMNSREACILRGLTAAAAEAPSSQLVTCNKKRLCTEAMLRSLELEIAKCKRMGCEPDRAASTHAALARTSSAPVCTELVLSEIIGAGGFGVVWRGTYKKSVTVAVKVMYSRSTEHEVMKDAVEMAVLGSVSHPNIVQVYACLTDQVEAGGRPAHKSYGDLQRSYSNSSGTGPSARYAPVFRRLMPYEDTDETDTCNIIVMEYCDLGSLRHVLQCSGIFHSRIRAAPSQGGGGGGSGGGMVLVDLPAIVEVALQVAEAVAYLHSIRLCHCDIKLDNVLLMSTPSQPRGYMAKLGDFGLVKVLGTSNAAINVGGAGTASHLAPEMFVAGSQITTAVDSYAFGIFLYELYTGGLHAYAGLSKKAVMEHVSLSEMRPIFPSGTPPSYAALAQACWAEDAALRPSFSSIIACLHSMLDGFQQQQPAAFDHGLKV